MNRVRSVESIAVRMLSEERMAQYTDAHSKAGIDARLPKLETWPNHFPAYEITIQYEPHRVCLELKALKMYLLAYRNLGIFYENAVNRMLRDIVDASRPVSCRVTGEFTPRGGLTTTVEAVGPRRGGNNRRRKA